MSPRRVISLLSVVILVAVAAGCADGSKLLPADRASTLENSLQRVADATGAGDCAAAKQGLADAQAAFAALPRTVDASLRGRIQEGLAQLARTMPAQCRATGQTTTPPTTSTPTDTATDTNATTTTTTTTTTTAPTTTTTTAPTATTPPTTQQTTPGTEPNGGTTPGQTTTGQAP